MGYIADFKNWRKVQKITSKYRDALEKAGYHVDWIGRIYKVINRPMDIKLGSDGDNLLMINDELEMANELSVWGLDALTKIKFTPIESDTENAYLVVMTPGLPGKEFLKPRHFFTIPATICCIIILSLILFLI